MKGSGVLSSRNQSPPVTKLSSHEQSYIQGGLQHTSSGWLASPIFLLLAAPHLWDVLTGAGR